MFVPRVPQSRFGIDFSVGCVGLKEFLPHIRQLRDALPAERYVWVNAFKDTPEYYDAATLDLLAQIDPLFPINTRHHPSLGRPCQCGSTVFAVDGEANVRRCHFVPQVLGNLHDAPLDRFRADSPCPNATCGCHIGYVHLNHLQLASVFGEGILERIPAKCLQLRPCSTESGSPSTLT